MYGFNKYHAKKTECNGLVFDSKKEASRYNELLLLEKSGIIKELELQKKFEIVPKTSKVRRARFYVADFVYTKDGMKIIEDVKSPVTKKNPVYSLKKALVQWQYPEFEFIET